MNTIKRFDNLIKCDLLRKYKVVCLRKKEEEEEEDNKTEESKSNLLVLGEV